MEKIYEILHPFIIQKASELINATDSNNTCKNLIKDHKYLILFYENNKIIKFNFINIFDKYDPSEDGPYSGIFEGYYFNKVFLKDDAYSWNTVISTEIYDINNIKFIEINDSFTLEYFKLFIKQNYNAEILIDFNYIKGKKNDFEELIKFEKKLDISEKCIYIIYYHLSQYSIPDITVCTKIEDFEDIICEVLLYNRENNFTIFKLL